MVLNYVPFFERENMEEFLQVGVISSTHGIAGEVKVFPTTDSLYLGMEKKSLQKTKTEFFGVKFILC